jgi:hypothetical protein
VADGGQPMQLALANNPSLEQLAAEATVPATPVAVADAPELAPPPVALTPAKELPAVAATEPVYEAPVASRADDFKAAFSAPLPAVSVATPAPVVADAAQFMRAPVVQPAPAGAAARSEVAATPRADGTHLVQLGSFSSEEGARRAWSIYTRNYPELAGHEMVISEAVVRGKRYWRVSAAGFARNTASSMCGRVRSTGNGCFAYAEGRPLPGAVDRGVRLARR